MLHNRKLYVNIDQLSGCEHFVLADKSHDEMTVYIVMDDDLYHTSICNLMKYESINSEFAYGILQRYYNDINFHKYRSEIISVILSDYSGTMACIVQSLNHLTNDEIMYIIEKYATPQIAYTILSHRHYIEHPSRINVRNFAESVISKSPEYSYKYAKFVLNGKFELGEEAITSSMLYHMRYKLFLNGESYEQDYL